jgi:SSS family transporter
MLTGLDYTIIVVYVIGVAFLGLRLAGTQVTTDDYFLGGRNLPWWVVCFSTVATETSTLTVIGLPAVAYGGSLTFLQLTFGYLLGRTVVSVLLLPRYYAGRLQTTYGFLGRRYGDSMRAAAALTFLVTRLLADGVRLFATAIPIKVIASAAGLAVGYTEIVFALVAVTLVYTYFGGIKAVVWVDTVQLVIYLVAGVVAIAFLLAEAPAGWFSDAIAAGKTSVINPGLSDSVIGTLTNWLTQPYALATAAIGGAVFSMASHGTDQLMVQRLLACRSLRDSQKALIGSGFLVMLQFAIFLLAGLLLWAYYDAADVASLGLSRTDEIFPKFIIEGLPSGVSGLLLAGIIAAAMSTLSSSVNSLASSSMIDLYERIRPPTANARDSLLIPRMLTLFWALVLACFASLLSDSGGTVVELGLTIASFTYGALLGVFLLGIVNRRSTQPDALFAFAVTIIALIAAVFGVWHSPDDGWLFLFRPSDAEVASRSLVPIAWPWFPVIGASVTLASGFVSSRLRPVPVAR